MECQLSATAIRLMFAGCKLGMAELLEFYRSRRIFGCKMDSKSGEFEL